MEIEEIERYIPEGREHAVSRKELRALLGKDDRLIREWIKQANRRLLARLRGEKIVRVRSYIRRVKAKPAPDGQEKWEV